MRVQFFGAAGEVTGSCHLVEANGKTILLDCGMVQSGKDEMGRNAAEFGFDVTKLDGMVLSHAHIDHVGRLPLLCKRGYRGNIYTHKATAELTRVMLEDAAQLNAKDIEYENQRRQRRGLKSLQPLYDLDDVQRVLSQLRAVDYGQRFNVTEGIEARLSDAGHIIGSAIVEVFGKTQGKERTLVFSGDIGPNGSPFLHDAEKISQADLVMLESTYGNRLHRPRSETVQELGEIFIRAQKNGGNVLIPAFAVGRSQEILYWMAQYFEQWELDRWTIALDSPMAIKVVSLYNKNIELFDLDARHAMRGKYHPFKLPNLKLVESGEESRAINKQKGGNIIIAGSGMCNGGRIKHHLKHNLWRDSTHVVFAGYQAFGTLGRELVDGAKTVRIFGETIKVRAQLHTVGGLSAHADQRGLSEWYGAFKTKPPVYLVHGEDPAREALAEILRRDYQAQVGLAQPAQIVEV